MESIKEILLVEDDKNDIELTLAALKEYNLTNNIKILRDGEEALNFLFKREEYENLPPGNPAIVLLDLNMPKVNGLEVLRSVRADEKLKYIPIVILTSSREEKDIVDSYRLGVNAYVVKPVDFRQFMDAVKKLGLFWALLNEPPPGSIKSENK